MVREMLNATPHRRDHEREQGEAQVDGQALRGHISSLHRCFLLFSGSGGQP